MDIIIVADSTNKMLAKMTQDTINSCHASDSIDFNIIVIDGNREASGFNKAITYTYKFPFNYNRCLNLGLSLTKDKYVALCNNDLLFGKNWATNIIRAMGEKYLSASPYNRFGDFNGIREGYRITKELLGWCIVIKRELLDIIGRLDEICDFWYSDNVYGVQLEKAGVKHILVKDSQVKHFGSRTLRKKRNISILTRRQRIKFDKWKNGN